jgi:alkyl hydroperoxide reductase subunit F
MQNESQNKIYDLIIIGGGPAGAAAGVYAGRKKLKTLVIKKEWGGQSVVSPDIHNWIGTKSIPGQKLADDLKDHVENYKGELLDIENDEVIGIEGEVLNYTVKTRNNKSFNSKTVLIVSGSNRKTLDVPGAKELEHKGLTYCASCDGLFFAGLDVVVVGAGNSAFESALQLLAYCKSVSVVIRGDESKIKADPDTVEAVKRDPKAKLIFNTESVSVIGTSPSAKASAGQEKVSGLKVKSNQTGEESILNVQGIFVEIGQIPNTEFAKGVVNIDKIGKIEIDPWTQKTSKEGIWAAGDCTNIRYHQNNIAAGDGVKALEDIYQYIRAHLS